MRYLDPRFRLVAALIDDASFSAEARTIARQQAEQIASACGMTFSDALWHAGMKLQPMLPNVAIRLHADDPFAAVDVSRARPEMSGCCPDEALDSKGDDVGDTNGGSAVNCRRDADHAEDTTPAGQIERALKSDPGRSDRNLARECGVSPTTIGKVRKALGLAKGVRTVTRGGKAYNMQVGERS